MIVDQFAAVQVFATANVLADLKADGPWMFDLLKGKLGPEAAERLVEPTAIDGFRVPLGERTLEVVEFGAGEAEHHACIHLPDRHAVIASDLIYNGAHSTSRSTTSKDGWRASASSSSSPPTPGSRRCTQDTGLPAGLP